MIVGIIPNGHLSWSLQTAVATAREATRQLIVATDVACALTESRADGRGPGDGSRTPGSPTVPCTATPTATSSPHGHITQEVTNRVENVPPVPLTC